MNIYCVNCGKNGHNYSTCKSPIISLGVILVYYDKNTKTLKYLMVCRKDTIGFIEFMRGKYSTKHLTKIDNPDIIGDEKDVPEINFL